MKEVSYFLDIDIPKECDPVVCRRVEDDDSLVCEAYVNKKWIRTEEASDVCFGYAPSRLLTEAEAMKLINED